MLTSDRHPDRRRNTGGDDGAVLVMVVFMLTAFMFMAALALDIGKQGLLKVRMQHTVELSAQAGAGAYDRVALAQTGLASLDDSRSRQLADQYFSLNQPSNVTISGVTIVIADDNLGCVAGCTVNGRTYFAPTVVVSARATSTRPLFAQLLGSSSMSVNVTAASSLQTGQVDFG